MYRLKSSIPVSYDNQGYIYFWSKRYKKLPKADRELIRRVCDEVGGDYAKALMVFVTTNRGAGAICGEFFLSEKTLERAVRAYYIAMNKRIK